MPRLHYVKKAGKSKKVRRCQVCGHLVAPGESYKWVKQRVGYPYFHSVHKFWCSEHQPGKHEFVQNEKRRALYEAHDLLNEGLVNTGEGESALDVLDEVASAVEGIAEMLLDNSQNIEHGFGHPTELSEDFAERAEAAERVAQDLRDLDVPDAPSGDEAEDEEAWEDWMEEVREKAQELLDEIEV